MAFPFEIFGGLGECLFGRGLGRGRGDDLANRGLGLGRGEDLVNNGLFKQQTEQLQRDLEWMRLVPITLQQDLESARRSAQPPIQVGYLPPTEPIPAEPLAPLVDLNPRRKIVFDDE